MSLRLSRGLSIRYGPARGRSRPLGGCNGQVREPRAARPREVGVRMRPAPSERQGRPRRRRTAPSGRHGRSYRPSFSASQRKPQIKPPTTAPMSTANHSTARFGHRHEPSLLRFQWLNIFGAWSRFQSQRKPTRRSRRRCRRGAAEITSALTSLRSSIPPPPQRRRGRHRRLSCRG
jgi:hypothetical protein